MLIVIQPILGCTQNRLDDVPLSNGPAQEVIAFPYPVSQAFSVGIGQNDSIWLLGADAEQSVIGVWELSANSEWQQLCDIREVLSLTEDQRLGCAELSFDGQIICSIVTEKETDVFVTDYQIDVNGRVAELPIKLPQDSSAQSSPIDGGRNFEMAFLHTTGQSLFILDSAGSLYKYNMQTGSKLFQCVLKEEQERIFSFVEIEGTILTVVGILSPSNVAYSLRSYDSETGDELEVDSALKDAFDTTILANEATRVISSSPVLSYYEHRLFVSSGIRTFVYSESSFQMLAETSDTILAKDNYAPLDFVYISDNQFYSYGVNIDSASPTFTLIKYVYDADESSESDFIIYSLEDNKEIRQFISLYNSAHPEAPVSYQVGLSESTTLTVDDAIRLLNTQIIAGDCPDILILDGLPISSYLKQGVLVDLSSVLSEARSTGRYFDIISACEVDDFCFALPLTFTQPLIFSQSEIVAQITSLSSLVDAAERSASFGPDSLVFGYAPVADHLLTLSYDTIINNDIVNVDALRLFMADFYRLSRIEQKNEQATAFGIEIENGALGSLDNKKKHRDVALEPIPLLLDPNCLAVGSMKSPYAFGMLELVKANSEKSADLVPLAFDGSKPFTPSTMLGVVNKGNDTSQAVAFVDFVFSSSLQLVNQEEGISVEVSAFERGITNVGGFELVLFERPPLSIDTLSEDTINAYIDAFSSLSTPVFKDRVIQEILFTETQRYINGELTLENAVNEASKRINLYLME